ncbi:MAG: hypothetical protein HMLKMBBP_02050 [Planctomycetes bacterium]|nr:hypothetical protein [Planctomycetota bacterium]
MLPRLAALLVLLPALAVAAPADPVADPGVTGRLAKVAAQLAAKGRKDDAAEVASVLASLRAPAPQVAEAEKAANSVAEGAKRKPCPEAASALKKAAAELAKGLATPDADVRKSLARAILRIDSDDDAAHDALGHEKTAEGWLDRETATVRDRRAKIAKAVADAKSLHLTPESGKSAHPILAAAAGREGSFARIGNVTLHAVEATEDQLRKVLLDTIRTAAVSRFIRKGDLAFVKPKRDVTLVFLPSDAFAKAVSAADASKALLYFDAATARANGFFVRREATVFEAVPGPETVRRQSLFHVWCTQLEGELGTGFEVQPSLTLGHLNWLYTYVLQIEMPNVVSSAKGVKGGTSDRPAKKSEDGVPLVDPDADREALRREVASRTDPPLSRAIAGVDRWGAIPGECVSKLTYVAEHLHETGEFEKLLMTMGTAKQSQPLWEKTLGCALEDYERRWRSWFTSGGRPPTGLVQRCGE